MRDAAEAEAIRIAGQYCRVSDPGNRPVIDMARQAYIAGFEAGRKTNRTAAAKQLAKKVNLA